MQNPEQSSNLEGATRRAMAGDRDALDWLVHELQSDIYGLALRMLCRREDAEDATQEILIRIITRLSQFDFRSNLKTWAYRIAVNYILDVKKSAVERLQLSFERLADDLTSSQHLGSPSETEQSLLIEEVKIGCTFGMLQCLDRPHRLAYILGEIMDLPGPEAAEILGISPELLRKRLQHGRAAILSFTKQYCGLASDSAPCQCNHQLPNAIRLGKMNGMTCNFAASPSSFQQIKAMVREVEETRWALQVHRSSRPRASSIDFARGLLDALQLRKA